MAATTESKKMIMLRSSDGEEFEIEEAVAMESQTIRHMIEDDCAESGIPLPNVTSEILSKVIEYCKKHVDSSSSSKSDDKAFDDELKAWDADFVKVDQPKLFDLILVWVVFLTWQRGFLLDCMSKFPGATDSCKTILMTDNVQSL